MCGSGTVYGVLPTATRRRAQPPSQPRRSVMTASRQPDDAAASGEAAARSGTAPTPAAIRTPDQRVRVFVSSTLEELAPERAAAREAIAQLRLSPVMFEAGARPYPPRDVYTSYVAQSDIFIGIYWQRYGWVGPGQEISGLEDEYGLGRGKPGLYYVKTPAPDREPGLTALLDRIRNEARTSYKHFSTPEELRELIGDDLAMLLTDRFITAGADARRDGADSRPAEADSRSDDADPRATASLHPPAGAVFGRDA